MRLKSIMNNPILAIGILMMVIFLFQLKDKGFFSGESGRLVPSSCKAVLVKLNRRIPANWTTSCEGRNYNNLAIEIQYQGKKQQEQLRPILYRELANYLILIAKNSPTDNLERTDIIRLRLNHPKLEINAVTEGAYLVKFSTLKSKTLIAQHLKSTVQVQERAK